MRAYIVDDEEEHRFAISNICKRRGIETLAFELPSEAIEELKRTKETPLCYFVDMRNPTEPNGPEELYNFVKTNGYDARFIFMSCHESLHDDGVLERTNTEFILKENLNEKVNRIISSLL